MELWAICHDLFALQVGKRAGRRDRQTLALLGVLAGVVKMKELIRRIVFPFMPAESPAVEGTLKFWLLSWLYEDEREPMFDAVWPDDLK